MNLKLLEKLVRLANNNPNENESNLAARRACKLIEDANFKFVPDVVTVRPQQPYAPPKPASTWNDVKRSPEPEFRSSYPGAGFNPDLDFIFEFFRTRDKQQPKDQRWDNIPKADPKEKPFNPFEGSPFRSVPFDSGFDFGRENPFTEYGGRRGGKTQKEKRPLNCHRCGKEYQTGFVGPPQMFTCNTCHWAIYHEEQEAKKK